MRVFYQSVKSILVIITLMSQFNCNAIINMSYNPNSGNITTIAGNGTAGFNGDGGAAIEAELNFPHGLAMDSDNNNIYIADSNNNRIRKIEVNGTIRTIAGTGNGGYSGDNGPATQADLLCPIGLVFDRSGNLYIADSGNHCIRKIDLNGIITTIAGNGNAGFTGDNISATSTSLNNPQHIAIDSSNNIYIADTNNNRIRKIDSIGIISTIAGNGTQGYSGDNLAATSAQLFHPCGIVFDTSDNLYIADAQNNRIRKINKSGIITTIAGTGSPYYSGDDGSATIACLFDPEGLAINNEGNVIIADMGNNCIREINDMGIIKTIAGYGSHGYSGDNGPPKLAQLDYPNSLVFDSSGNLLICDVNNHRIRQIWK